MKSLFKFPIIPCRRLHNPHKKWTMVDKQDPRYIAFKYHVKTDEGNLQRPEVWVMNTRNCYKFILMRVTSVGGFLYCDTSSGKRYACLDRRLNPGDLVCAFVGYRPENYSLMLGMDDIHTESPAITFQGYMTGQEIEAKHGTEIIWL